MTNAACILVVTEVAADAELVRRLLRDEFENVVCSTDPAREVQDFEKHRPDVLVLAFNSLQKAERYYLGLYRLGTLVHALPHRTVILCDQGDLRRVYELCRKEHFDDYVLFWPVPHDAPRLPMAVHHVLRQLAAGNAAAPTAGEFAAQAQRLAAMESLLEQYAARGGARIDAASQSLFQLEIDRMKEGETVPTLEAVAHALQPVREWAGAIKQDLAPQIESARALQVLAESYRPFVLAVDDDSYQHALLRTVLREANVELAFATTGLQALATLRKRRPDLILMDVRLPDIDGVEATRRIKSVERFASIPILVITGHSDKDMVVQSIKAGAAGFVVKPFNKDILLAKVRNCLHRMDA